MEWKMYVNVSCIHLGSKKTLQIKRTALKSTVATNELGFKINYS